MFDNLLAGVDLKDLPESIQPRADDVVYLGGANCTSTDTRTKKSPTPTEPSSETSLLSATTMPTLASTDTPLASGTPKLNATAAETLQPELITSTGEMAALVVSPEAYDALVKILDNPPKPNEALKALFKRYEAEVFEPPFKLPMEG
jgi:hypothetical protein